MRLGQADLSFLVSNAPDQPAGQVVERKEKAAAVQTAAPQEPTEDAENAEDAMAQQIRDDGTMDTSDSELFEEEE